MAVEGVPVGGRRSRFRGGPPPAGAAPAAGARPGGVWCRPGGAAVREGQAVRVDLAEGCLAGPGKPIPDQDAAQVSANWPAGQRGRRDGELPVPGSAEVADCAGCRRRRLSRVRLISRSRLRGRTALCLQRRTGSWWCCRRSRAGQSSCGVWINLATDHGESCPRRFRIPRSRWRSRRSAPVQRRFPSSIRRATNSTGC